MAIKDIISPGIGFSPGRVGFIVTRGLGVASGAGGVLSWKADGRQIDYSSLFRVIDYLSEYRPLDYMADE